MGHTRLGTIPKSRKWSEVVAELARFGSDVAAEQRTLQAGIATIARRAIEAAGGALKGAADDIGLRYTFYLLTQITLSAREEDWVEALRKNGIDLSGSSSVFDLTVELQAAVDRRISASSHPSDVSEMAQSAAGEAIAALASSEAVTMFGSGRDELQRAIRSLSTKKGFSDLGQVFFGRFIARLLNFYLSRVTASQLGAGEFRQVGEISSFNQALQAHCEQSARIVRDFCGEWYSKTEFIQGIDLENASAFVAVALKKLRSELQRQEAEA
ncbi:MAG: hypothetical protein WB763_20940 [Terriglobia bacterium]|jgi:hypothetical protein